MRMIRFRQILVVIIVSSLTWYAFSMLRVFHARKEQVTSNSPQGRVSSFKTEHVQEDTHERATTFATEHAQKDTHDICKGPWIEKYKRFHDNSLKNQNSSTRFLIYWCRGHGAGCGGFGNRLFGIMSTFYLAILTNRVFVIHWGGPEKLEDFLSPNKIDWTFKDSYTKSTNYKSYWGVMRVGGHDNVRAEPEGNFWKWVSEDANFDVLLSHQVESIGSIWYAAEQLKRNPYLKKRWQSIGLPVVTESFTLIGCAFDFLFQKSPHLEQHYRAAKSRLKFDNRHPLIGIHIRTTDKHWNPNWLDLKRTRSLETVRKCSQRVENILKARLNTNDEIPWFLAADDDKIKSNWIEKHPKKVLTHDGVPIHFQHAPSKSTLTDLLVDIFLLSECDYLIGTRDSTFSNVAIGLGQFPASKWLYGEECDDLDTKIKHDYDYVFNETFISLLGH